MEASIVAVGVGSPRHSEDASLTPDLQHSRYMSGESDDDTAHATPSDLTSAAQSSPRASWPIPKMRSGEDDVRKIHYIDSSAQDTATATTISLPNRIASPPASLSNTLTLPQMTSVDSRSIETTAPSASTVVNATDTASQTTVAQAAQSASLSASTPSGTPAASGGSDILQAAGSAPPSAAMPSHAFQTMTVAAKAVPAGQMNTSSADPSPARVISTAPSSTASTPASTPGATPQTYARKRGRPRKHPLPDPDSMPAKVKRKLSTDSAAVTAKKKANAAAAARSTASSAGLLLSVPDLGRLIPQGSSSENAQTFIQNNLRLFADLFVALQKQASTDHAVREEANAQLQGITEVSLDQPGSTNSHQQSAQSAAHAGIHAPATASSSSSAAAAAAASRQADTGVGALTSASTNPVSGPSDALREEIKKKMADVTKGREALQAEMLQMRVDASFFENAQKTVDERIVVLRQRIAARTALLQREREATRKAREASRIAKKDRKAREKGLRDSEREERRLAQTFEQLEREIAAEEEERRRLEEAESSDEDDEPAEADTRTVGQSTCGALDQLDGFNASFLDATPSEATSMSATATPSVTNDTPAPTDRAIGFSDEELAKVLGISTSELAGFSQTLELTGSQALSSNSVLNVESDPASTLAAMLAPSTQPPAQDELSVDATSDATAADSFDVAAFLEMASSFGAVAASSGAPSTEEHSNGN